MNKDDQHSLRYIDCDFTCSHMSSCDINIPPGIPS